MDNSELIEKIHKQMLVCNEEYAFKNFPNHGEMLSEMANMLYNPPEGTPNTDSMISLATVQSADKEDQILFVIGFHIDGGELNYMFTELTKSNLCFTKASITIMAGTIAQMGVGYDVKNLFAMICNQFSKDVGHEKLRKLSINDCPEEYKSIVAKQIRHDFNQGRE